MKNNRINKSFSSIPATSNRHAPYNCSYSLLEIWFYQIFNLSMLHLLRFFFAERFHELIPKPGLTAFYLMVIEENLSTPIWCRTPEIKERGEVLGRFFIKK